MSMALIGASGFVGSHLAKKLTPSKLIGSNTPVGPLEIEEVICAAPSGLKWYANKFPELDRTHVQLLMDRLALLSCSKITLISTVDVYKHTDDANEESALCERSNAYGFHRWQLEEFVYDHFDNVQVLRLSGLVGSALKKNPIYDLKHNNNLHVLNGHSMMQFIPIEFVSDYITNNSFQGKTTVNLTAEPVQLGEVSDLIGISLESAAPIVSYDVKSLIAINRGHNGYFVSAIDSLSAIRAYFDSR